MMTVLRYGMQMVVTFIQGKMKKILLFLIVSFIGIGVYGQKITALPAVTSAVDGSLMIIRSGTSGNTLSSISKSNLLKEQAQTNITALADSLLDRYTKTQADSRYDAKLDIADTVVISDVAPLLADTSLIFSWTIGAGNATDTTLFSFGDVIAGAKWGGSHSLVITKVTGVVHGTTPDIDVAVLYDANFRDATPTAVLSSDLTITSTTTGDDGTINASNDTIADGVWLWLRIDECTAQPTQAIINIYGYLE